MTFYETLQESFTEVSLHQLAIRSLFAFALIIIGVLIGRLIDAAFRKIIEKFDINKHIRGTFCELFLLVIRWTIYIFFIYLGLNQLEVPVISDFLSSILITIPAFTGALLLLVLGVGLAYYLRTIIKNAETKASEFMSYVVFYFVIFIFSIYSIWIALIPLNPETTSYIIVFMTTIALAGVIYYHTKKELHAR